MTKRWHTQKGLEVGVTKYDIASPYIKGKAVLDIACGDGIGTAYLGSQEAGFVFGGDISLDNLRSARKLGGQNCALAGLDVRRLPIRDEVFDVVVSIETIEHLLEQEEYLQEVHRVLKPGGRFICSTVNHDVFATEDRKHWFPGHVKELNIAEFSELMGRYFNNISLYGMPYKETMGSFGRTIYRYEEPLVKLLLGFPPTRWLLRFMTRYIFTRYHLVQAEEIGGDNLGKFINPEYKPFPLENIDTRFVIGVAEK